MKTSKIEKINKKIKQRKERVIKGRTKVQREMKELRIQGEQQGTELVPLLVGVDGCE